MNKILFYPMPNHQINNMHLKNIHISAFFLMKNEPMQSTLFNI